MELDKILAAMIVADPHNSLEDENPEASFSEDDLIRAIRQGEDSRVIQLCRSLKPRKENLDQYLLEAVQAGKIGCVEYFIREGANINTRFEDGFYLLAYAASLGSITIVGLLLDHSADISVGTEEMWGPGRQAYHVACEENHPVVVEMLFERGFAPDPKEQASQILLAIQKGHREVEHFLLTYNIEFNQFYREAYGAFYLTEACLSGCFERAKMHLNLGISPNTLMQNSPSLLAITCGSHFFDIAYLLLSADADPNIVDQYGTTPLHWLCASPPGRYTNGFPRPGLETYLVFLAELIRRGANPYMKRGNPNSSSNGYQYALVNAYIIPRGLSPLAYCIMIGRMDIVQVIFDALPNSLANLESHSLE